MKNTIKFPNISFIHPLQPSPTKVHHVPMMETLVNGMQWKSKQKNIVKYELRLVYIKTKTQLVQRAKETDKAHTTLIR